MGVLVVVGEAVNVGVAVGVGVLVVVGLAVWGGVAVAWGVSVAVGAIVNGLVDGATVGESSASWATLPGTNHSSKSDATRAMTARVTAMAVCVNLVNASLLVPVTALGDLRPVGICPGSSPDL